MSQITTGIYSTLSNFYIYKIFQKLMSATTYRHNLIKKYVKNKRPTILDIGCGPAEILEKIQNVRYYGYDINRNYINYAKKRYSGKNYSFFCKKFTEKEISKLPKFDYIILFGLLHHLKDPEIKKIFLLIKKVMKKDGNILTADPVFIKNQNFIANFLISKDRGKNVRSEKEYINLTKKFFKKVETRVTNQIFIPYTYFSMYLKKK